MYQCSRFKLQPTLLSSHGLVSCVSEADIYVIVILWTYDVKTKIRPV